MEYVDGLISDDYSPCAAAGLAFARLGARLGTGTLTCGASFRTFDLDGLLGAERDVIERKPYGDADVLAPAFIPMGAPAAEDGLEPSHATEIAHEDVESLGEVDVVESSAPRPDTCFAVPVVRGPLPRISQNFVGFGDLLEPSLGIRG